MATRRRRSGKSAAVTSTSSGHPASQRLQTIRRPSRCFRAHQHRREIETAVALDAAPADAFVHVFKADVVHARIIGEDPVAVRRVVRPDEMIGAVERRDPERRKRRAAFAARSASRAAGTHGSLGISELAPQRHACEASDGGAVRKRWRLERSSRSFSASGLAAFLQSPCRAISACRATCACDGTIRPHCTVS